MLFLAVNKLRCLVSGLLSVSAAVGSMAVRVAITDLKKKRKKVPLITLLP